MTEIETFTISGIDTFRKKVDSKQTHFLAVKLVNILEIKYLKKNLTDKKVYQPINKPNKAKYNYDQAKY